jgi:hypothetical protein
MASTSDGGATWTSITPTSNIYLSGLDTARGKFISYGPCNPNGNNTLNDFGYSESTDGISWTSVQTAIPFVMLDGSGGATVALQRIVSAHMGCTKQ